MVGDMKVFRYLVLGTLFFGAAIRAQETHVLLQNQQIKVEVTKVRESCAVFLSAKAESPPASPDATCTEMAITNNSNVAITAWVATAESGSSAGKTKGSRIDVFLDDCVNDPICMEHERGGESQSYHIVLDDRLNDAAILPHGTHHVALGNWGEVQFRAAVFQNGSVCGAPQWVDRIVQNRRRVYQDIGETLKTLREARQAGTSRKQIIDSLQKLQRREDALLRGNHGISASRERLWPRFAVYWTIAQSLLPRQTDACSLGDDLNYTESMLLGLGNRLLASQPPLSDHSAPLGEAPERADTVNCSRENTAIPMIGSIRENGRHAEMVTPLH